MSERKRTALFVASQLAMVFVATVVACYGLNDSVKHHNLPEFADKPLNVRPQYDDPRVVGDAQLQQLLAKLVPPSLKEFPKVNHIDHALRFWGLEARFANPDLPSGTEMRDFLVDDKFFLGTSKGKARSLMRERSTGVSFRTQEGRNTSSHEDHTLATLAEIGTPLSFELKTAAGPRPLRAALVHALRTFALDQPEYEWSTIIFALYQVQQDDWRTHEGRRISWDRIAERLMRQRMGQGCCYGGHRLFTLTILLRLDAEHQVLFTDDIRSEIVEHLWDATQRLVANQSPEGAMDGRWPGEPILKDDKLSSIGQQLLSTGHALEWWAMAPEEVQPPRENVVRAGQWMAAKILSLSEKQVRDNYTFLTHAGRALVLWRGKFPAEFWNATADQRTKLTHDVHRGHRGEVIISGGTRE